MMVYPIVVLLFDGENSTSYELLDLLLSPIHGEDHVVAVAAVAAVVDSD